MEGAVRSGLAAAACALAPGPRAAPVHRNEAGRAKEPGDELPLPRTSTLTSSVDPVTLEVRQ
jgi:hypothetical protein